MTIYISVNIKIFLLPNIDRKHQIITKRQIENTYLTLTFQRQQSKPFNEWKMRKPDTACCITTAKYFQSLHCSILIVFLALFNEIYCCKILLGDASVNFFSTQTLHHCCRTFCFPECKSKLR